MPEEPPPHDPAGDTDRPLERTKSLPDVSPAPAPNPRCGPGESPGESIGPYRLVSRIGEGGFGIVWLAEQSQPVRRRVALKIIKPGMDSVAVVARFEAERQALAMMSHPGIAKIIDAGTTALTPAGGGRPYFVMEYVDGAPITKYCDQERLTVEQRLRLFVLVCDAVQHAHRKGIIHRDLKPSNILVTVGESGPPRPVVIDFGIAKALADPLIDQTLMTEKGVLLGTPAYMSPEQADNSEMDIDTRTDVYALGVVLYELLTGAVPFDPRTLRAAGREAILNVIRHQPPPRPSARLSTLGEQSESVAAARRVRLDELAATLRRELEWIPLKAIRKDRDERYRSANELADDVSNYLAHRPLIAGPERAAYKIRKFARRHRGAVAAGAVVAASLVAASGVSTWFGIREARAAIRARGIKDFLKKTFGYANPNQVSSRQDIAVSEAIQRALRDMREGALAQQSIDRAELLDFCAVILINTGHGEDALAPAKEALHIRQATLPRDHPDVLDSLNHVATALQDLGDLTAAEATLSDVYERCKALHKGDHHDVAENLSDLALVRQTLGRVQEADPMFSEALGMYRRLNPGDHPDTAAAIKNLARSRQMLGRMAEADTLYAEALAMRERLFGNDHLMVAVGLSDLAFAKNELGRADEAETLARRAQEMCQRHREWRSDVCDGATFLLSTALALQGKSEQAIGAAAAGLAPGSEGHAGVLAKVAATLVQQHTAASARAALPLLRECLAIRERVYPDGHERAWSKYNVMSLLGEATLAEAGIVFGGESPASAAATQPGPAVHAAFVEAERLLLEAWRHLKDDPHVPTASQMNGADRRRDALARVAAMYRAWDAVEPAEAGGRAASWVQQLSAYDRANQASTPPR